MFFINYSLRIYCTFPHIHWLPSYIAEEVKGYGVKFLQWRLFGVAYGSYCMNGRNVTLILQQQQQSELKTLIVYKCVL